MEPIKRKRLPLKARAYIFLQKIGIHHCPFCGGWDVCFRPRPFQIIHHCKLNLATMKFERVSV